MKRPAQVKALLVGLVLAGASACAETRSPERTGDLDRAVRDFVSAQRAPSAGYRLAPDSAATARSVLSARPGGGYHILKGPEGTLLAVPRVLPDPEGGGLFALRPGGLRLGVEVPHPLDDLDTDLLGAELATSTRAAYLLVAGAGRQLAGGGADVSHAPASLFQSAHLVLVGWGVPVIQLHGFAATSLRGFDVVLSAGSAAPSALALRVARAVSATGLRTCLAWNQDCGQLEGRTNVQGRASAEAGTPFVHVEVTRSVRASRTAREALVQAIAGAVDPLP